MEQLNTSQNGAVLSSCSTMNSSETNRLLGALRVVDGTDFPRADSATVLATPPLRSSRVLTCRINDSFRCPTPRPPGASDSSSVLGQVKCPF